jgi:glycosyltransferase involved in cell wall biosynthesis
MYCGACQRDASLLTALAASGHDLLAIPLYTPLRTDHPPVCTMSSIYMGGISLYLEETFSFLRHMPAFVRRQLDRPGLLNGLSRLAVRTAPAKLGKMAVGMLAGMEGPHREEIARLVGFLQQEFRPEIVNLGNVLLASLAPPLRAALHVPIVATLQGEESFIEGLPAPYGGEALALLRRHAGSIDRFVSCAAARVAPLAEWLGVPVERVGVVPTGMDAAPFAPAGASGGAAARGDGGGNRPAVLGYLSSIRREKGLDLLIEALRELGEGPARDVRLAMAGQVLDKRYWRGVREAIRRHGLEGRVTYHGELDLPGKAAFLRGCDLFVMPTRLHEQRAMAAMEALAAGVPVIASRRGVLEELLARTGGGVTVAAEDPGALARAVAALLDDVEARRRYAASGPPAMAAYYSPEAMARRTVGEYETLLRGNMAPA